MNKGKEIKLNELSEHKLKRLITKLSEIRKKKYIRRKDTKYGNINKGFTDNEIKRFLEVSRTHNEKCFVSFFIMGNLGLRIGEVVKIKLDDIDLIKNKIRISTEKSHTGDFLYLHSKVRKCLIWWFEKHQEKILKNDGYVLFSNNRNSKTPHVTPEWLRKKFREICYLSDLNEHYGFSDDENNTLSVNRGVQHRKLHRLTPHSLRHWFITSVYKHCKNPLHTQKLSRHQNFKSTQVYIHSTGEELDETMKQVFEDEGIENKDEEVEEFIKVFNMYKEMKKG